jgi:hypothetical protein
MTILSKTERRVSKIEIDLSGPEGNAFYLLGVGKDLCNQLKWDFKPIHNEMTSGDYENLLLVFDKYFGDYVDLFR